MNQQNLLHGRFARRLDLMWCSSLIIILIVTQLSIRESECNTLLERCPHGVTRNSWGRPVCAAGPGERCGESDNQLGMCGEGLTCKCGMCSGCSITRLMTGIIECEHKSPNCK